MKKLHYYSFYDPTLDLVYNVYSEFKKTTDKMALKWIAEYRGGLARKQGVKENQVKTRDKIIALIVHEDGTIRGPELVLQKRQEKKRRPQKS